MGSASFAEIQDESGKMQIYLRRDDICPGEDKTMYKRVTLIVKESKIIKVFYPIFPPDKHIFDILEWLKNNSEKKTVDINPEPASKNETKIIEEKSF